MNQGYHNVSGVQMQISEDIEYNRQVQTDYLEYEVIVRSRWSVHIIIRNRE